MLPAEVAAYTFPTVSKDKILQFYLQKMLVLKLHKK